MHTSFFLINLFMNYFFVKTTWVHVYPWLRSYAPVCDEKNDINFLFTKQKSNWFKAIKIQTNKKKKHNNNNNNNNNNTYCMWLHACFPQF